MPVIGRLDEQVDALLISPLAKKRRTGPEETAPAEQQQPPAPTATARDETDTDIESKPGRETLPVWLL